MSFELPIFFFFGFGDAIRKSNVAFDERPQKPYFEQVTASSLIARNDLPFPARARGCDWLGLWPNVLLGFKPHAWSIPSVYLYGAYCLIDHTLTCQRTKTEKSTYGIMLSLKNTSDVTPDLSLDRRWARA